MSSLLIEGVQIVPAFSAVVADMDTDQTGDYVSLKNYGKVGVLFVKQAGTAGDDPNLLLYEASDVSGTGAQALACIDTYWIKQAATTLNATGTFTKVTQSAAATIGFNATSAEQCIVAYFEVDATQLSEGFDCIRVDATLDASGGAQFGTVLYLLQSPRYEEATSLSAIAD
jgi:hypothetical protein